MKPSLSRIPPDRSRGTYRAVPRFAKTWALVLPTLGFLLSSRLIIMHAHPAGGRLVGRSRVSTLRPTIRCVMTTSTKGLQEQTQLEIREESLLYEIWERVSIVFLHEKRDLLRPIKGKGSLKVGIGRGSPCFLAGKRDAQTKRMDAKWESAENYLVQQAKGSHVEEDQEKRMENGFKVGIIEDYLV
ncbi:hypothetical protein [Absidia glauca]|uniref:Uncharacterized protein n=1 Tax=Absidia glauca TaxID=4829 RepID=A0A168RVA0_ABSGL|nr:hypothetical protein [Absidia glauca]